MVEVTDPAVATAPPAPTTLGDLRASGVSVLLVEQNAQSALQIADRAYVMELGEFVLSGPASEIATNQRVAASYLGFTHEGASGI